MVAMSIISALEKEAGGLLKTQIQPIPHRESQAMFDVIIVSKVLPSPTPPQKTLQIFNRPFNSKIPMAL